MLAASYAIYWMVSGKLVVLLLLLSTSDFLLVSLMQARPQYRRACLMLSVISNLSVLFFFKYLNFFLDQFQLLDGSLGLDAQSPVLAILAPVGISFIVFHGISYSADAYRGTILQRPRYHEYLLYIAYFPKLLAGPITRLNEFVPQLGELQRLRLADTLSGGQLVMMGLFKKIVLAAIFAQYWNQLRATPQDGPLLLYAAGSCYGLFLLADFSGYTDLARGISLILGLDLPKNFAEPYGATSVSAFWRRWHMSLSFWLRDYLYFRSAVANSDSRGPWLTYSRPWCSAASGMARHGASCCGA